MKKHFSSIYLVVLLSLLVLHNSCTNPTETYKEKKEILSSFESWIADAYMYVGIMPCTDCDATRTTLFISKDYSQFQLLEQKPGEATERLTKGQLNTERGFETDEDATLFILNDDKPVAEQRYFVRKTGSENLYPCDTNRKLITGPVEYVLNRVKL